MELGHTGRGIFPFCALGTLALSCSLRGQRVALPSRRRLGQLCLSPHWEGAAPAAPSSPHAFLRGGVVGKQPAGSWGGGQVDPAVLGVSQQTRQLRAPKAEACVWGLNGGGRFNSMDLGGGSERLGVSRWQNSCVAVGRLPDLPEPLASSGEP